MQLTWLPERGRFVGTQTEAKQMKASFEVVDVPTDKQGLLDYLNDLHTGYQARLVERDVPPPLPDDRPDIQGAPDVKVEPYNDMHGQAVAMGYPSILEALEHLAELKEAKPSKAAPAQTIGDLTAAVSELDGPPLFNVLQAAISRLHEVAGSDGWSRFVTHATAWGKGIALDRGLGMLFVAGMRQMFHVDEGGSGDAVG